VRVSLSNNADDQSNSSFLRSPVSVILGVLFLPQLSFLGALYCQSMCDDCRLSASRRDGPRSPILFPPIRSLLYHIGFVRLFFLHCFRTPPPPQPRLCSKFPIGHEFLPPFRDRPPLSPLIYIGYQGPQLLMLLHICCLSLLLVALLWIL